MSGANGLSIPIRGRLGEFALFTVTSNESAAEWRAMKRELLRDLMIVAFNFHAAALRACGAEWEAAVHLPLREASCLRWKALGKTDEEIGTHTRHQLAHGPVSPRSRRAHDSTRRTRPTPSPRRWRSD